MKSILFLMAMLALPLVSVGLDQIPVTYEQWVILAEQRARQVRIELSAQSEASRGKRVTFAVRNGEEVKEIASLISIDFALYDPTDMVQTYGEVTDKDGHLLFSGSHDSEISHRNGQYFLKDWNVELNLNYQVPLQVKDFEYAQINYVDEDGRKREMYVHDDWGDGVFMFPVREVAGRVTMIILHTHDDDGHHIKAYGASGHLIQPVQTRLFVGVKFRDIDFINVGPDRESLYLGVHTSTDNVGHNKVFKVNIKSPNQALTIKGVTSQGKFPYALVVNMGLEEDEIDQPLREMEYPLTDGQTPEPLVFPDSGVYFLYFRWNPKDLSPPPDDGYGKGSVDR